MKTVVVDVRDLQNNPTIRRVRLHRMDTGAVLGEGYSNGISGNWVFETDYQGEAYAVGLPSRSGVIEEMTIRRTVL